MPKLSAKHVYTFSQAGNDSKWFLKKSFFKIGMWHSRPPRDPPPLMANAILNFHFDFLTPSLICGYLGYTKCFGFTRIVGQNLIVWVA